MSRKNRYYPPEFKREALEMLATGKYTQAQIEQDLGITIGLLHQWKRVAELNGEYKSPQKEPKTAAEAEARIRELERENVRLRLEGRTQLRIRCRYGGPRDPLYAPS